MNHYRRLVEPGLHDDDGVGLVEGGLAEDGGRGHGVQLVLGRQEAQVDHFSLQTVRDFHGQVADEDQLEGAGPLFLVAGEAVDQKRRVLGRVPAAGVEEKGVGQIVSSPEPAGLAQRLRLHPPGQEEGLLLRQVPDIGGQLPFGRAQEDDPGGGQEGLPDRFQVGVALVVETGYGHAGLGP